MSNYTGEGNSKKVARLIVTAECGVKRHETRARRKLERLSQSVIMQALLVALLVGMGVLAVRA